MRGQGQTAALLRFLDRLRLLLGVAAAASALLNCLAVAAVALVLNALVVERLSAWPWAAFALAAAGTLGVAVAVLRLIRALAPPSRRTAALLAQSGEPDLRNDVASSLDLAPLLVAPARGISSPLVGALVGSTGERLAGFAPRRFVPWRGLRTGILILVAAAAPLAWLALVDGIPGAAARALVDPRVYWPLGRLQLEVEPGEALVARGSDLLVRVRAGGSRPAGVSIDFEGSTGQGQAAMVRGREGDWSWRFAAVTGEFSYRAQAGGAASPWYRVRVAELPAAGNFEVRYTYPAYSALEARTVAGSGQIESLKGTSVEISFETNVDVAGVALVFGGARVAVRPAGERRYSAKLYLNGESFYRIELVDASGLGNGGGSQYAVRYLPDAPPSVEVTEPVGDMESEPRGTVVVRYRAADDYGLSRLALVAGVAGVAEVAGERRWPLPLSAGARSAGGEHVLDLSGLAVQPGDVVAVWVEAVDNDTISGSKVSASAPFSVRIADPRHKREQTREAMAELSDDLVRLLGEELELQASYQDLETQTADAENFPWEGHQQADGLQTAARDTAVRAEERAASLAQSLERDPGAREETIFQAELIQRGLAELRERLQAPMQQLASDLGPETTTTEEARQRTGALAESAGRAVRKAEELVLMAEAMKRERGMDDVDRGAGEMADAEQRLLDGLERLSPGDRAAAAKVLEELKQIEQALRELAQALLEKNKDLPEEFLNSDAIKTLDLDEILDTLDQVRESLSRGDVAGARRAARELAQRLANLRNSLRQAEDEVDARAQQALERLGQSAIPRMRNLAERQRALLERTEGLEARVGPRWEQALREMARTRDTSAPPAESDLLTPEERGRAEVLAREQDELRRITVELAGEIAALRAALPFLPADVGSGLEEAAVLMGDAGGRLEAFEPAWALPPQRGALAALQRAGDQAQQALDEMSQMQQMRQGQPGKPGFGGQAGMGLGGSSSRSRSGRRSGGRGGTDVRNFVIPGRQDHRVPKIFREEIMKALRDGYPAGYERRIKDYYQRITE